MANVKMMILLMEIRYVPNLAKYVGHHLGFWCETCFLFLTKICVSDCVYMIRCMMYVYIYMYSYVQQCLLNDVLFR